MGSTRRPLVWWAGHGAGALLDQLDGAVVGAVAMAQGVAARNDAFLGDVRRRGLGLLLEGEPWRAQLDPAHPARAAAGFNALPWVDAAAAHVPEAWPARFCEDFAEAYVEHQADLATLLTTPGHHADEPVGPVRRRDVELAALCADHVRARALREPRPGDPHRARRTLAATIVVRADRLDAAATRWLVDAYAAVDVDQYVVWAVDFSAAEAQARALFGLAAGLRERTGREVVLGGLGHLWQAALAGDVAGVVCGQRSALRRPDPALRVDPDADDRTGWGVAAYHGAILGCTAIGAPGDVARRRLFMRHPCRCGHHQVGAPPVGQAETLAHNLWWAQREARQALALDAGRAQLLLAIRAAAAAEQRERFGLGPLPTGWRVVGDVADAQADDGADDPA